MFNKQIFGLLVLALIAGSVSFYSCKREKVLGNNICPSSSFVFSTPLSVSSTSVNLKTGHLNIIAAFSEVIGWKVIIKGKTTGALKQYVGTSDSLNIDWYGNGETDVFFDAEVVSVDIEIACEGIKSDMSKTVTITNRPTLENTDFAMFLSDYDVVPSKFPTSAGWPNPITNNYCIKRDTLPTGMSSPQGGNCLRLRGGVTQPNSLVWYFGGYQQAIGTSVASFIAKSKMTNTDSIYLNMYVYGYNSTNPNSQIVMSFSVGGVLHQLVQNVDWDGWKMVSVKMSSLKSLHVYDAFAATSDLVMELGAGPLQASKAECLIDFIILTAGAPYKEIQKRNY